MSVMSGKKESPYSTRPGLIFIGILERKYEGSSRRQSIRPSHRSAVVVTEVDTSECERFTCGK